MAPALCVLGGLMVLALLYLAVTLYGLVPLADGLGALGKTVGLGEADPWLIGGLITAVVAMISLSALVVPRQGTVVLGLAVAAAFGFLAFETYDGYGRLANVGRWTGDREWNWLRPWLTEFRTVILCAGGFLLLSCLSWIWSKFGLGH